MSLNTKNPTTTEAWQKLQKHFSDIKDTHMLDWFETNPNRANDLRIKWDDFYVDFSKNRITKETLTLFNDLAQEIQLQDAISQYFGGEKINQTENRAVLHTALRAPKQEAVFFEGKNIIPDVYSVKDKMKQ